MLRFLTLVGCAIVGLLTGRPAMAQIMPVRFVAEAWMATDQGEATSCGVRLFGVQFLPDERLAVDGSVNANAKGVIAVKGGAFRLIATQDTKNPIRRTSLGFVLSWVRITDGPVLLPVNGLGVMKAQDPGFQLYAAPRGAGLSFLYKVATEPTQVMFGFKRGDGREAIFSGPVTWEAGAADEFTTCLARVTSKWLNN